MESTESATATIGGTVKDALIRALLANLKAIGKFLIVLILVAAYMAGFGYFGTMVITGIEGFDTTFTTEQDRQEVTPWIFAGFSALGLITVIVSAIFLGILILMAAAWRKFIQGDDSK